MRNFIMILMIMIINMEIIIMIISVKILIKTRRWLRKGSLQRENSLLLTEAQYDSTVSAQFSFFVFHLFFWRGVGCSQYKIIVIDTAFHIFVLVYFKLVKTFIEILSGTPA